jgi:hypothetical protein
MSLSLPLLAEMKPKTKATRKCAKHFQPIRKKPKLDGLTKGKIAMGVDNNLSRVEIQKQLDLGKAVQLWPVDIQKQDKWNVSKAVEDLE